MQSIKEFLARKDIVAIKSHTEGEKMARDFFRDPLRSVVINHDLFYAPADGVVLYAKPNVKPDDFLDIKGADFSLKQLLADPEYDKPSLVIGIFMCYSDDTEVFTDNGWKLFSALSGSELILTRKRTGEAEWQPIKALQKYPYAGNLINLKNRNVDLLVTPNHKIPTVPTKEVKSKKYATDYKYYLAKDVAGSHSYGMPLTFNWNGNHTGFFILPPVMIDNYKRKTKPLIIAMQDWMAFMGLYISEGSCYKNNKIFRVVISQKNEWNFKVIEDVLNKLPFNWHVDKQKNGNRNYLIDSKQLCRYLMPLGTARKKYIPDDIKNLSKEYLTPLLKYLHIGDGWEGNGCCQYITSSKTLAEDVAEITYKCGKRANIIKRKACSGGMIGGRAIIGGGQYCVITGKTDYTIFTNIKKKEIPYTGYVYDLTVPETHVIWVRRNGKCVWSSNSALDVHINRVPASCYYIDRRETNKIETHGISMIMEENDLLQECECHTDDLEYMVTNEKQTSLFYCPDIRSRFYLTQIGDKDIDVIVNWGKGTFLQQGDRFGQIRYGSQVDMTLPLKKGLKYEILVKPLDHVEAGLDPILRIVRTKK